MLNTQEARSSDRTRELILYKRFLLRVALSSDKLLPFRNFAISRKIILKPGGPYSADRIRTKEGLFSAIVHRGITHNTDFLRETKRTLFTSLDDWTAACRPYRDQHLGDKFFCDQCAYGMPNTARKVENVESYWKWVQKQKNIAWLTSEDKIDPYDLFKRFQKLVGFGPLVAYQLMLDYAEQPGMTEELTIDHMAQIICDINRGGMKGLVRLGYEVDKNHPGQVVQALESLHASLVGVFPEDQRNRMGFGLGFMEHALCKLKRLDVTHFKDWKNHATEITLVSS